MPPRSRKSFPRSAEPEFPDKRIKHFLPCKIRTHSEHGRNFLCTHARVWALCALLLAAAVVLTAFSPMLPAHAEGNAPVAQNLELTTYRNVSVGGRLTAVDPDGDTLSYAVTTEPTKGEVELTDDGRFVYTPDTNRKGRDYFGYKATDSEGNSSQEATVIIRIEKQKTRTTYSDLAGDPSQYAATMLAEEGIFVGQQLGGSYVFEPGREVTRGEFLAMCMELGGEELLSAVAATGFADDADIPVWQKRYVATALMDGVISGTVSDGASVFDPESSITVQEAAVMLNNVLGATGRAHSRIRRPRARLGGPGHGEPHRLRRPHLLLKVHRYPHPRRCRANDTRSRVGVRDGRE